MTIELSGLRAKVFRLEHEREDLLKLFAIPCIGSGSLSERILQVLVDRHSLIESIKAAMWCLEKMPCGGVSAGGVGANGADQEKLDAANKDGIAYSGENYHQTQQAWLHLAKALKDLERK